jgi:hypothetical protein
MKTIAKTITVGVVMCLLFTFRAVAIEGLQLSLQCSNVVLSWPSVEGETYIIECRPTLDANSSWQRLASDLPAEIGTSTTAFVHSNAVQYPNCEGGSFAAMSFGEGESTALVAAVEDDTPTVATAIPTNGVGDAVPLELFPPGFDLSGYVIYEPTTATLVKGSALSASAFTMDTPQPLDGGGTYGGEGSPTLETGFYRVVRTGIHLAGITNGMVLEGQVSLAFEFGNADTNRVIDQVFLTDNDSDATLSGSSFPTFPLPLGDSSAGVWETTHTTNGTYLLQLGALLDDGSVVMDTPIAVTVSNALYLPDPWNVGGAAIYVGYKSVFTNGTWHLDVYDHQDAYLGYLDGDIDSDGNCNYPGIPGPGFSLDNTDGYGNQNPTPSYKLAMRAQAAASETASKSATNRVFIEPPWMFGGTRSVVCYQQVFPSYQDGATEVRLLVGLAWGVEQVFHQNLIGSSELPHEIELAGGWGVVTNNLAQFGSRDFFYFGHGSEGTLGSGGVTLHLDDVKKLLGNNFKDPLSATNMHPYRFVFMDGCNTADGDWPQAFGIPKKTGMVFADFWNKRGIRARAFMGWNRTKAVGTGIISGGQLNPDHENYIGKFWDWWGHGTSGDRSVQDAIDQARLVAPSAADGMVLYGAEDLRMTD